MTTGYAAATSLLVERKWEQLSDGPVGELWGKGTARAPLPYAIELGGRPWRLFLEGVAGVEKTSADDLARWVTRLIATTDAPIEKRSTSDGRALLDLHVDGATVQSHETDARDFGQLLSRMSDAVGALVKDRTGVKRYRSALKIKGAASEGSVSMLLVEGQADVAPGLVAADSVRSEESLALRRLIQILNAADEAAERPRDSQLDAQLKVGLDARSALRRLASALEEGGWRTRGQLFNVSEEPLTLSFSLAGAHRLRVAANQRHLHSYQESHEGVVDAWDWSDGELKLKDDEGNRTTMVVPVMLQERVASLMASRQRATVSATVAERRTPNNEVISRARLVVDVEAVDELPV